MAEAAKSKSEPAKSVLDSLLSDLQDDSKGLQQGLANLNKLPKYSEFEEAKEANDSKKLEKLEVKGKPFERGVIGFQRNYKGGLSLIIACGKAQARSIPLAKFIALIENMYEKGSETIIIQNFKDQDNNQSSRGQTLARINPDSSAITIIQGVTGKVVRGPYDIALFDVYYINRTDLTAYYLAAKAQISNQNELETMIQAFDGWKHFDVPLDPLNPY